MSKPSLTALLFAVTALSTSLPSNAAIPSATCRSTDHVETGVSGEMPLADRASATKAFNCNVDLVGQYQGEGASWQLTAWKNCAYFDQRRNAAEVNRGVVVMDVSDPTHPTPTKWLSEPSMIDPWESLKVNNARQLLGGDEQGGPGLAQYDISADCKNPVLKSSVALPGSIGHTGQYAPDGNTYYITPLRASPSIIAVDTTDPANPAILPNGIETFAVPSMFHSSTVHDLEFSKDGNTAYLALPGANGNNGLGILDVSDFQQRKPNPQWRSIGFIGWDDGSRGAQNALPITIAGKPYVLFTDEAGGAAGACPLNKSPSGFPRLIDISNPAQPTVTSKMILGVHDPANCTAIVNNSAAATATVNGVQTYTQGIFGYSCHYCQVDDVDNAKVAGCGCFAAGFRIFDIHDPVNVREIAYYKPPGIGTALQAGSYLSAFQGTSPAGAPPFSQAYDWATSKASWPKDRGATTGDIWITSQNNGFMVIKLFSAVSVSPKTLTTGHDQTESFKATVTGASANAGAVWSVQEGAAGGTIDPNGTYHAPSTGGTYHLVATALLDSSKTDVATVTVLGPHGGCSTGGASITAILGALGGVLLVRRRRRAS